MDQRATVRVDPPALLPLAWRLHSCARVASAHCDRSTPADVVWKGHEGGGYAIDLLGNHWEGGMDASSIFLQSENLLTQIFSIRHADKLQFHAGAAVSSDGRAWLIAGESGAGKTSVTLSLMLEGWKWMTDEMVLVADRRSDEIEGVPRNFNIKEVSFPRFPETAGRLEGVELRSPARNCLIRFIDPEELAPGAFAPGARLGGILFPVFTPGLSRPRLRPCAGTSLAGRLVSSISRPTDWAMDWIIHVGVKTPAWELLYEDPRTAASILRTPSDMKPAEGA